VLKGTRLNNIYVINLDIASSRTISCLVSKDQDPSLCHKRASHIHMHHLNKIISKELVFGLQKLNFEKDKICVSCQKGKQTKTSFKSKKIISTTRPLELLHIDLFGPSRTKSLGGNYYALVIVDDFSRFTWTFFLPTKSNAFNSFKKIAKSIQNQKHLKIFFLRTDDGGEFQNEQFEIFCEEFVITLNFSSPRTPQQN